LTEKNDQTIYRALTRRKFDFLLVLSLEIIAKKVFFQDRILYKTRSN
jgi:hypothetical protein